MQKKYTGDWVYRGSQRGFHGVKGTTTVYADTSEAAEKAIRKVAAEQLIGSTHYAAGFEVTLRQ
jgi:hypothetical protein